MILIPLSDIYTLNNQPLPQPSVANPQISGLQIFGERTEDGLLHKETVAFKRHVSLKYDVLTQREYQRILNLILQEPYQEYYNFKYFDPQHGIHTIECYTNEFGGDLYSAILYNGLWRNVSFNCIER